MVSVTKLFIDDLCMNFRSPIGGRARKDSFGEKQRTGDCIEAPSECHRRSDARD